MNFSLTFPSTLGFIPSVLFFPLYFPPLYYILSLQLSSCVQSNASGKHLSHQALEPRISSSRFPFVCSSQ